ncbi:MAG: hypothetical protein J6Q11_09435 [Fibrobacteraceae bacterium]|nr:hypothetical protein [Fibrobacteraceae bacterium]
MKLSCISQEGRCCGKSITTRLSFHHSPNHVIICHRESLIFGYKKETL